MTEVPVEVDSVSPIATEVPVEEDSLSLIADGETEESGAEVTIGEILEAAPEDTQVVVLDENGEALPLVSVEAAEIVEGSDPIWCPAGAPPDALSGGCTNVYASLNALLNFLVANQANPVYDQAGVIWIERFYDSSVNDSFFTTEFVLDGATDFSHMSQHALTIQGGYHPASGPVINRDDPLYTPSLFSGDSLRIINWVGNVTINDIEILNSGATGLVVETQGDIDLDHVVANGNTDDGAYLDNCLWNGAACTGSGGIQVTASSFSDNGDYGIEAHSTGDIMLSGVIANANVTEGAYLDTCNLDPVSEECTRGGSVNVSSSSFSDNGFGGLDVRTKGSATLSNVTATGSVAGAALDASLNIDLSQSYFTGNLFAGLLAVSSTGDITVSQSNASSNGLLGALLTTDAGDVSVSSSSFDGNGLIPGQAGLFIVSGGDVTLDTISASNNLTMFGIGVMSNNLLIKNSTLNENEGDGVALDTIGDAAIICSTFDSNLGVGIDGSAVNGVFTLNDVTFSGNTVDYEYDGTPNILSSGCTVVVPPTPDPTNELPFIDFTGDLHVQSKSLPLHIVPVGGGEKVDLDCRGYSGTKLILPNGDQVTLPCPIQDQGVLTGKTTGQLPAPLNAPFVFASALDIQVTRGGKALDKVNQEMTIDFVIPDGMQGKDFVLLRWDAEKSQWVEVSSGVKTGDGRFIASSNLTGIYVLVTK